METDIDTRFKLVKVFLKCVRHVKLKDDMLSSQLNSFISDLDLNTLDFEINGWNSELGNKYAQFQHDMAIQTIIKSKIIYINSFIKEVCDKYPNLINDDFSSDLGLEYEGLM